jgi:hypothetical protein
VRLDSALQKKKRPLKDAFPNTPSLELPTDKIDLQLNVVNGIGVVSPGTKGLRCIHTHRCHCR